MAESKEIMTEDLMKTILGLYKGEIVETQSKVKEALKKNVQNLAIGKTTAEKKILLTKLGTIDTDLQKAFALDMAESKEIMDEAVATEMLDMYKDGSVEAKKKIEEALKNNIENFAKKKGDRETLVTTSGDARIRKLAGQVMADKKEVDSWTLRRAILEENGGIDSTTGDANTAEGRALAKSIEDGNVAIKEETNYRKPTASRPAIPASSDLNQSQHSDVKEQIITNIENKLITGFSTEELQTPEVFNALYDGVRTGRIPVTQFDKLAGLSTGKGGGKPDRKKREAGAKIAEAAFQGGAPLPYS
jgi:hypothetical protein